MWRRAYKEFSITRTCSTGSPKISRSAAAMFAGMEERRPSSV
jgi:hypothetical protein